MMTLDMDGSLDVIQLHLLPLLIATAKIHYGENLITPEN